MKSRNGTAMVLVHEVRSIGIHPEEVTIVGVPVGKIRKIEPYKSRCWNSDATAVIDGQGRSVLRTSEEVSDVYVTESVDELVAQINGRPES